MPKVDIDYSNTIIYKITCNDTNVKDVYVGHTTNFVQRKHAHKQSCINEKSSNNKCKLYDVIRANGGWLNWTMEIIHFCNCKNHYEARIKEQEYFVLLNANLNSIEPMPPNKPITSSTIDSNQIELTSDISLNNTQKNEKYSCKKCDYTTSRLSQYNRHIMTPKHKMVLTPEIESFKIQKCSCGKIYTYYSGLYRHKKTCEDINTTIDEITEIEDNEENTELQNNNVILDILKQNQDFKGLMIEQSKQMMEQSKQIMEQSKQIMELMKNPSNKSV